MELFDLDGNRETHENLAAFGQAPARSLALKFADETEDGRWVVDADDLLLLRLADAPLSYTAIGLATIAEEEQVLDAIDIVRDAVQGWQAHYTGPHATDIARLFGTSVLPLGLAASCDAPAVLAAINANHPGVLVTLGGEVR